MLGGWGVGEKNKNNRKTGILLKILIMFIVHNGM